MTHNSLPGFDAWLTHNPLDDQPEPLQKHLDKAYDMLFHDDPLDDSYIPSENEVYNLACMLMQEEIDQRNEDAAQAEADSIQDDRDREGDGPL